MASLALNDAFVSLAGTDISAFVESVDLDYQVETDDDAAMGDDTAIVAATRENWSVSITAKQDYGASQLDSVLWAAASGKVAVALIVRPTSGAVSTSNPEFTGNVILTNYKPIAGSHGSLARTPIALAPASDLARATS